LGLAQDQQGRDGWPAISRALQLAPDDPLVNYAAGVHWRLKEQYPQALVALFSARAQAPQNPAITAEIGLVYQADGFLAEADRWLMRAVSLAPDEAGFAVLRASFYADTGYDLTGQGLQVIRDVVARVPGDADARASLGWALMTGGQYDEAEDELRQALILAPDNPRARYYFAVLLEYRGDVRNAAAEYLFVYGTDNRRFRNLAARALARLGYQP
jgi:Flp pilus assembly protein TadD